MGSDDPVASKTSMIEGLLAGKPFFPEVNVEMDMLECLPRQIRRPVWGHPQRPGTGLQGFGLRTVYYIYMPHDPCGLIRQADFL